MVLIVTEENSRGIFHDSIFINDFLGTLDLIDFPSDTFTQLILDGVGVFGEGESGGIGINLSRGEIDEGSLWTESGFQ